MFWYRQDLGQGLKLLFNFYYKEEKEKGTNSSHFQADQPQDDLFRLNISSVQPEHSALYFCASSLDTALQSHLLPLQKPHLFLVSQQPQHRKLQAGCHHMDSNKALTLGHTDTKITQTPILVLKRGQRAQLTCRQTDGHSYMYWYQQQQGKGLQLIYYSFAVDKKEKGQTDAKITQTPSLVLERGQTAYLRCQQTYGHNSMFWYRQDPGQGLQLLFNFYYKEEREKDTNSSHFQADQPQNDLFRLNISSVQPEHSAVYFCASSLDTALQSHLLPLQKPHLFLVTLQRYNRDGNKAHSL
ncbi:hypothetical protein KIL84_018288 [Mauremys mutica]|uniref:Ig-like domain-containing protein n=1 Tax=Mauremys mutica TaxID=74926 RepID=A0A9D3XRL8_9SAUR|nr:hypothetical protein KIL84_018288 [Mauremys mutica]